MKMAPVSLLLGVCVLLLSGPAVSAVSLDVEPNLQQFFTGTLVFLRCADDQQTGGLTVKRTRGEQTDQCGSGFGFFDISSCFITDLSQSDSGVYWCETSSGQKSLQVDIMVKTGYLILEIPALPVMTGSDVTLSCNSKIGNITHKTEQADFFRNGTKFGHGPDGELNISRVQQSDEGFYMCSTDWLDASPKSWLRVRDPPPPPTSPPPSTSPPPLSSSPPSSPLPSWFLWFLWFFWSWSWSWFCGGGDTQLSLI